MTTKYLDDNGLLYLWQKIRNTFVSDVTWDSTNKKLVKKKKTGTSGAEQSTDIVTFSTVATSGSYNDLSNKPTIPTLKNVFGKVKVGSTTIEADTTQDTLELSAGSNVTLTPDATNDKVTIAATVPVTDVTVDGTSVVSSGVAAITTPEKIFFATYGTTSYADIKSAYDAGKIVLCLYSPLASVTDVYLLTSILDSMATFSGVANNGKTARVCVVYASGNTWGTSLSKTIVNGVKVNNTSVVDSDNIAQLTLGTASAKDTVTSISADSTDLPTVTAVKNYVATAVTGATAFQGTAPTTFAPTNYKAGYYWVVGTAGTYTGQTCEAGDMIFATADGTTYSASDFDVIQTNLDITSITNAEIDTIVAS